MRTLTAFMHKEWIESVRTGKITLLALLFVVFGIMNPAVAKLTPWLLKQMAAGMAETGLSVSEVRIDALTSWAQFYKNMPMALLIFALVFSGVLTNEYAKGTLIPLVAKGLGRRKILASKGLMIAALWTVGFWTSYGITYGYNAFFWDNGAAAHLPFAAFGLYGFGLWLISLLLLFSTFADSGSGVVLGTVLLLAAVYLLGLLPALNDYAPVRLLETAKLAAGSGPPSDYAAALAVAAVWAAVNIGIAVLRFDRKTI